jgi:hypothetical protein
MCSNSLPRGWSSRRASRIASYYLAGVSMPSRASTTSRKTSTISLKTARNTLSSAGDSCAISDSVFKNHQFFFANPVLQLRVRAIPNFRYENLTADALINAMATTWSSLIAEGFHDSRIQANAQVCLCSYVIHTRIESYIFSSCLHLSRTRSLGFSRRSFPLTSVAI